MARPSKFSQKIANKICERLSDGESLRAICESSSMPSRPTVFRWLSQSLQFRDQYARAREAQADLMAEEILEIADDKDADTQRSRLRFDARKWLASKMAPKKYGDKVTQEHTGPDGGPVEVEQKVEQNINLTVSAEEAYLRMIGK